MINYQTLDKCMPKPETTWFWSKFKLAPDDADNYVNTIYKGYLKKNHQQTFIVPNKNDNINAKLSLKFIPKDIMTHHHETRGYRIALLNNIQTISFASLLNAVMFIEIEKARRGSNQFLSEKEIAAKLTKLKTLNDYDLYLALLSELTPHKLLTELKPFAFDNNINDLESSLFKKADKNNVYRFTASYNNHQYLRVN